MILEELILENLREIVSFASRSKDEFVRLVMDSDLRQRDRDLAKRKRQLADSEKRITELDAFLLYTSPIRQSNTVLKSPSLYRVFLSLSAYLGELSCRFFLNVRFHQTFQLHGNTLVALFPKEGIDDKGRVADLFFAPLRRGVFLFR